MAEKILQVNPVTGKIVQTEIITASSGSPDAGKPVGLDESGRWDLTTMPVGISPTVKQLITTDTLAAGNVVNIYNDGGTAKCRKADGSSAGKTADGYVLSAASIGATATVYTETTITGLSALTPGTTYFLDKTAGGVTATVPTKAAGWDFIQEVGKSLSATEIAFKPGTSITLA